jgi:L,D-transpeptidase YcfS
LLLLDQINKILKSMQQVFYIFLLLIFNINSFATNTFYSISVCTTSTEDGANNCKNKISKYTKENVFIIEDKNDKKFRTYIGSFNTYKEAKKLLNSSSSFIKKQKPFIKEIRKESENPIVTIEKTINDFDNEYSKSLESFYLKKLNITSNNKTIKENKFINKLESFDTLIVEVDSKKNIMHLKGKDKKQETNLKSYKVSTARNDIIKPLGEGSITAISLQPKWYPTKNTLKAFKRKGINLPSIVPYGHKLNYMGAAKINLTHRVKGQEVYRIHGTLNEDTIGSNESSGCIRMKNDEVLQLASMLNNFANLKSFNDIKVILK